MNASVPVPQPGRSEAGRLAGAGAKDGGVSGLSLGALLAEEALAIKLAAGGPASHRRAVTGTVLLGTPAAPGLDAVEEGALAVADGALGDWDADRRRALVAELAARGAAALALTVDHLEERVPRGTLEEAMRLGFPLLLVAGPTSRAELGQFVEAARARSALEALRRSVSAQDYLMEALAEARPVDALVRRLAWLLAGEALLFNEGGHVVTATGVVRSEQIWAQIASREAAHQQFNAGACNVTSVPVVIGGRVRYWLAAVTRRQVSSEQEPRSVIRVAERLLGLIALARTAADDDEQALRSGLLTGALEERDPRRLQEIAQRAQRFGLTYAEPCRVAVAAPRAPGRWAGAPAAPSPAERLRRLLAERHTPFLLDEQPGRVIALVQSDCAEVDEWAAALERDGIDLVVGIGRRHPSLGQAHGSLRDAELAAGQVGDGHGAAVVRFDDCDLANWVIGIAAERIEPKVESLLAEIKGDERLYQTLIAYLAADLDTRATASRLHLHVNSVRYRLGRIESILGRPLQKVATLADLYIAVTVDQASAGVPAQARR
jgi:purine catabolism regulator